MMKNLFAFLIALGLAAGAHAQTSLKMPVVDKSPMDMVYFPNNYPVLKIQDKATEPLYMRVIYSRPLKAGRPIFGELVEYNQVWRLGANEATEIEFFRDVKVQGKKLAKGKYTLYALVKPESWTIIFNKETDIWGAFKYNEKKDVLRVTVPVEKTGENFEAFSIVFDKTANGANMIMAWDDTKVSLPISVK